MATHCPSCCHSFTKHLTPQLKRDSITYSAASWTCHQRGEGNVYRTSLFNVNSMLHRLPSGPRTSALWSDISQKRLCEPPPPPSPPTQVFSLWSQRPCRPLLPPPLPPVLPQKCCNSLFYVKYILHRLLSGPRTSALWFQTSQRHPCHPPQTPILKPRPAAGLRS